MRKMGIGVALVVTACAHGPSADDLSPENGRYRVVRFHVKPGSEAEFEHFFTESLVPAAEKLAESPEALQRDLDAFVLLRPLNSLPAQPSTYYVLFKEMGGEASGEAMRDLVRRAFPAAEARERVQRWMSTLDLESLVPIGEEFERVVLRPTG